MITESIHVIDSDTIAIDRQISDHDGTYVTFKCGFSNQNLINDEPDVNNACSNFTNDFLTIAKECIPTREVTIHTDDKMWFDCNLPRESRRRDRLRKTFLRTKTVSA